MEFDTLSRLNDILQIPFFSLSFLLLSQLFLWFCFLFSFRSIFVCSVVHTSCAHSVCFHGFCTYIDQKMKKKNTKSRVQARKPDQVTIISCADEFQRKIDKRRLQFYTQKFISSEINSAEIIGGIKLTAKYFTMNIRTQQTKNFQLSTNFQHATYEQTQTHACIYGGRNRSVLFSSLDFPSSVAKNSKLKILAERQQILSHSHVFIHTLRGNLLCHTTELFISLE